MFKNLQWKTDAATEVEESPLQGNLHFQEDVHIEI